MRIHLSLPAILLALPLCLPGLAGAEQPAKARPNVLWITCEDMSPTLGCYGDPYARTPHLDRLAARSVRYDNAFSVAGVCAPSRSCLITGLYPSSLGSQHMRCTGRLPGFVTAYTEPLRKAGYYCTNNVKTDYNLRIPLASAWDESSNKAHWRNRKPGQPFFSIFNFTTTHEGQIRAPDAAFERHMQLIPGQPRHDPAKANIPPYYPDTPVVRRDWARHADLISAMDQQVANLLKQLEDDGLAGDTIVFFYSDHGAGLPRAKRWIYDSGMRVPLLIHFPQKFADLAPGKPGTSTDRLVSFVDFGPTLQSLVGIKPAEHIQGIPFLGEYAGKPREYVHGIRDRMDERYDFTRAIRDKRYKFIRNYMPNVPWAQTIEYMDMMPTMREWRRLAAEGKLEGPQKLFLADRKPFEEFYDLEKDPHETNNLIDSAELDGEVKRMRAALGKWMDETIDLGFLPESELHDRFPKETPYEAVRKNPDLYPLKRARYLVEYGDLGRAVEALGDRDSVMRFQAAHMLKAPEARDNPAMTAALKKALGDDAACVRVAAADALVHHGQVEGALPVLVEALKNENEYTRLAAINVLDRLGAKARPALEAVRAASEDKNDYVKRVARHTLQRLEK